MSRNHEIRSLVPLRPTDDLTDDEVRAVENLVRYDEAARDELADYTKILEQVREAAAQPLPTDGRESLWDRIEPRLGPAGKLRRDPLATRKWAVAWPMQYAAAAGVLLFIVFAPNWSYWFPANSAQIGPATVSVPASVGNRITPVAADAVLVRHFGGFVQTIDAALAHRLRVQEGSGVVLVDLFVGSPAHRMGLRASDVILRVAGLPVRSAAEFESVLARCPPNALLPFDIVRQGRAFRVLGSIGDWNGPADNEPTLEEQMLPLSGEIILIRRLPVEI